MPKFRYYCPRSTSEPGHSDFVISWLDKQVPLAYCKTCDEHLVVEDYKLVLKPRETPEDIQRESEGRLLQTMMAEFRQATQLTPRTTKQVLQFAKQMKALVNVDLDEEGARNLVNQLKVVLQASPLTINFKAPILAKFTKPEILNAFEIPGENSGNIDNSAKKQERIEAEGELFGHPIPGGVSLQLPYMNWNTESHMLKTSSVRPKPASGPFQAVMNAARLRPRYGALDYSDSDRGATPNASNYGLCFFVLSDEVKKRATYTLGDSFDARGEEKDVFPVLFSYDSLDVLILRAIVVNYELKILYHLCRRAGKTEPPVNVVCATPTYEDKDSYLEAQIFGPLRFGDDVAEVHISTSELNNAKAEERKTVETLVAKYRKEFPKIKWVEFS